MTSRDGTDGVLVLDSDTQCAMSVIRSLGSKHVPITAGGSSRWSLGMFSRYSDETYVYPDPDSDHTAFVDHLVDHLRRSDYVAVIPATDHSSLILSRYKERIERTGTTVAVEDWETFDRAFDKGKLADALASIDVPTPETHSPADMNDVAAIADEIEYPALVKPRCKSHLHDTGYTVTLVGDENYVHSPAELRRTYRRLSREQDYAEGRYPLVQEYVPGTTTTTVALADGGDVLAYFQEERLRTYPASGGNSALLAAVREPTMLEYTERVLDRLDWTGPVMVEFMRTPDGEFYVIEVNGRYWGSLPFAVESGVDIPWFHYLLLRGFDPSPLIDVGAYRTDVLQRRLLYEDIKWLGEHLASGRPGAVVPFVRSFGTTRHTFVSLDDPVPTAGALLQGAYLAAESIRQRVLPGENQS